MTLAVMSRASFGHTGRALVATGATQAVYALVLLAALARISPAPTAVEHEFASCFGSRLGSRLPGLRGDVLAGADRTARRTLRRPLFDMEQGAGRGAILSFANEATRRRP